LLPHGDGHGVGAGCEQPVDAIPDSEIGDKAKATTK
jgi:hypothetical protein